MINKICKIKSTRIIVLIMFYTFISIFFNSCFANENLNTHENLTLYCNNNLLMDYETGNVLYEKNGYSKVYPASTTKVLTAILALENLDLNENVTVSKKAINSVPIGSSVMEIKEGEIYSVENLLYGLLLPSGNDAAIVLAEAISGNSDDFANLMNTKAKEIGCLNTHFVNPHGFYDPNHYSTAYDMALILQYAMKYDKFREISETLEWELPQTNKSDKTRILKNTNRLLDKDYSVYYKYAIGGKTGYTIESRGTYIGYAKKDDKLVIVANFDGSQNINGKNARFLDSITLSNYAFDNFDKEQILSKDSFKYMIINENEHKKYEISLKEDVSLLTKSNVVKKIIPNFSITPTSDNKLNINLELNIKDNISNIHKNYETNIISRKDFKSYKEITVYFKYIILSVLILIFFILLKKQYRH